MRIRSELNHNHDVSKSIQKDMEYESKVRNGGNNRTKCEVDSASSVRIRSELNHN